MVCRMILLLKGESKRCYRLTNNMHGRSTHITTASSRPLSPLAGICLRRLDRFEGGSGLLAKLVRLIIGVELTHGRFDVGGQFLQKDVRVVTIHFVAHDL